MTISKDRYYNIFFQEVTNILLILAASLIPWMEFINTNYNELDNIFNDNFLFLIILYFAAVTILYFLTKLFFKKKNKLYYISIIGISIWIFFQFNLLKSVFNKIFSGTYIWHISSEISLFLVIALIIILTFVLNKNNWRLFILFFLIFNFIYSGIVLFPKLIAFKTDNNIIKLKEADSIKFISDKTNKPNIYFFISDAMKPLNEFKDFYKIKLNDFEKLYKKNGYNYYNDTSNLYVWTEPVLTGFFFLEEDIYKSDSADTNKILKPNIYKTFPTLLKDGYISPLIRELNNLNYRFKWIGNYSQNCSNTNYKYCLNNAKKNFIDKYTLQAFLSKSPLVQIFDNLIQLKFVNQFFDLKILHSDAIWEIDNFININQNYIKNMEPTFFFIHEMEAHEPYFVDSNCKDQRFPGNYNLEGYKNSYLCVIKKISKIIKTIEEFDPNSIVVFQSDHSWIMSTQSEEKFGKRNNIFNLIKNNAICKKNLPNNPNNINTLKYILNCLKT
jgi:hypothetical protein